MVIEDKIDIDIFKVVTSAIYHSENLEVMTDQLSQLLVASLGIKGCALFVLNFDTKELEIVADFGLSIKYINKGPVLTNKSIADTIDGKPVVVSDINTSNLLQYPEQAREEGIGAIVSVPILFSGKVIGAIRLYHHETWDVSDRDLDSLLLLGEVIGLAMMYTRMLNSVRSFKEIIDEIHPAWLGVPEMK